MNRIYKFLVPLCFVALACCNKTDVLTSATVNDYYPLQVGKYSIYKLDSSLFVKFGQVKEIHSYVLKDVIDAQITDNLGRPSYRVISLLRNSADTLLWDEHATYLVTPLPNSLELISDNLRFIKLQLPIKPYLSWNGNRYLPDEPFSQFDFSNSDHLHLDSWEYNYENTDSSITVNGHVYDSTISVVCSVADSMNFPPTAKNAPGFKTDWRERYAKGVGLVSREVSFEEFQPSSPTYPNGYFTGFEIKQTLLEHN